MIVLYNYRKALTAWILILSQILLPVPAQAELVLNYTADPTPLDFSSSIEWPASLAKIRFEHRGEGPQIIHLQTAHGHYGSQKKTQEILNLLYEQYDFDLFLVEGSVGALSAERINFYPNNPEQTQQLADELVRQSILKGDELFLLEHPEVKIYGIEDMQTYREGREIYRQIIMEKKKADRFFADMDLLADDLAVHILNADLLDFVKKEKAYDQGLISHQEWWHLLERLSLKKLNLDFQSPYQQLNWPMLTRLAHIQQQSRKLEESLFLKEKESLLKEIDEDANISIEAKEQIRKILNLNLDGNTQDWNAQEKIVWDSFIEWFSDYLDQERYEQISGRLMVHMLSPELDGLSLEKEKDLLIEEIKKSLLLSGQEKDFLEWNKRYALLKRLWALELSSDDYSDIHGSQQVKDLSVDPVHLLKALQGFDPENKTKVAQYSMDPDCLTFHKGALDFYQSVYDRDPQMIRNIESRIRAGNGKKVVLITGGFHSQAFKEYFSREDYDYTLISPAFSGAGDRQSYLDMILQSEEESLKRATMETPRLSEALPIRQGLGENTVWVAERLKTLASQIGLPSPDIYERTVNTGPRFLQASSLGGTQLTALAVLTGEYSDDLEGGKAVIIDTLDWFLTNQYAVDGHVLPQVIYERYRNEISKATELKSRTILFDKTRDGIAVNVKYLSNTLELVQKSQSVGLFMELLGAPVIREMMGLWAMSQEPLDPDIREDEYIRVFETEMMAELSTNVISWPNQRISEFISARDEFLGQSIQHLLEIELYESRQYQKALHWAEEAGVYSEEGASQALDELGTDLQLEYERGILSLDDGARTALANTIALIVRMQENRIRQRSWLPDASNEKLLLREELAKKIDSLFNILFSDDKQVSRHERIFFLYMIHQQDQDRLDLARVLQAFGDIQFWQSLDTLDRVVEDLYPPIQSSIQQLDKTLLAMTTATNEQGPVAEQAVYDVASSRSSATETNFGAIAFLRATDTQLQEALQKAGVKQKKQKLILKELRRLQAQQSKVADVTSALEQNELLGQSPEVAKLVQLFSFESALPIFFTKDYSENKAGAEAFLLDSIDWLLANALNESWAEEDAKLLREYRKAIPQAQDFLGNPNLILGKVRLGDPLLMNTPTVLWLIKHLQRLQSVDLFLELIGGTLIREARGYYLLSFSDGDTQNNADVYTRVFKEALSEYTGKAFGLRWPDAKQDEFLAIHQEELLNLVGHSIAFEYYERLHYRYILRRWWQKGHYDPSRSYGALQADYDRASEVLKDLDPARQSDEFDRLNDRKATDQKLAGISRFQNQDLDLPEDAHKTIKEELHNMSLVALHSIMENTATTANFYVYVLYMIYLDSIEKFDLNGFYKLPKEDFSRHPQDLFNEATKMVFPAIAKYLRGWDPSFRDVLISMSEPFPGPEPSASSLGQTNTLSLVKNRRLYLEILIEYWTNELESLSMQSIRRVQTSPVDFEILPMTAEILEAERKEIREKIKSFEDKIKEPDELIRKRVLLKTMSAILDQYPNRDRPVPLRFSDDVRNRLQEYAGFGFKEVFPEDSKWALLKTAFDQIPQAMDERMFFVQDEEGITYNFKKGGGERAYFSDSRSGLGVYVYARHGKVTLEHLQRYVVIANLLAEHFKDHPRFRVPTYEIVKLHRPGLNEAFYGVQTTHIDGETVEERLRTSHSNGELTISVDRFIRAVADYFKSQDLPYVRIDDGMQSALGGKDLHHGNFIQEGGYLVGFDLFFADSLSYIPEKIRALIPEMSGQDADIPSHEPDVSIDEVVPYYADALMQVHRSDLTSDARITGLSPEDQAWLDQETLNAWRRNVVAKWLYYDREMPELLKMAELINQRRSDSNPELILGEYFQFANVFSYILDHDISPWNDGARESLSDQLASWLEAGELGAQETPMEKTTSFDYREPAEKRRDHVKAITKVFKKQVMMHLFKDFRNKARADFAEILSSQGLGPDVQQSELEAFLVTWEELLLKKLNSHLLFAHDRKLESYAKQIDDWVAPLEVGDKTAKSLGNAQTAEIADSLLVLRGYIFPPGIPVSPDILSKRFLSLRMPDPQSIPIWSDEQYHQAQRFLGLRPDSRTEFDSTDQQLDRDALDIYFLGSGLLTQEGGLDWVETPFFQDAGLFFVVTQPKHRRTLEVFNQERVSRGQDAIPMHDSVAQALDALRASSLKQDLQIFGFSSFEEHSAEWDRLLGEGYQQLNRSRLLSFSKAFNLLGFQEKLQAIQKTSQAA